jgi:hypothetical protein
MFNRKSCAVIVTIAAMVPATAALAGGGTLTSSCIGGWGNRSCVLQWREGTRDPHVVHAWAPRSDIEAREAEQRDRKWLAYCRPVIRYDRYGVGRYHYARPGCEFGRSED